MKRIIIATISVILSVAVSAQDRTPMDKIWEEIEKITTARQDSKMKVNHGGGQLLYVHNGIVGKEFLCSTDCEGVTTSFNNFTPEEIENLRRHPAQPRLINGNLGRELSLRVT